MAGTSPGMTAAANRRSRPHKKEEPLVDDKRPKSREETPEHNPNRIAAKERSRKALAYL